MIRRRWAVRDRRSGDLLDCIGTTSGVHDQTLLFVFGEDAQAFIDSYLTNTEQKHHEPVRLRTLVKRRLGLPKKKA